MFRRALAGLLTVLLIAGGLLAAPAPAAAAGDQDYQAATRLLVRYGLVQGDQRGYRWGEAITRAEVAKLLVYSLGYGSQAQQYQGRREFPDTAGHWAEGVVSLAKSLGIMRGYPEGDFRPENPVSYGEIVTALARLAGLEPGAEPWPYTYFTPARTAGIIPADMALEGRSGDAAIRGDVFVLLKRTLADVKNFKGQTLLQLYLDKVPPTLTVDPLPDTTPSASVAVAGTASDAAVVRINGQPATVADGAYFRLDVPLTVGPNTIRVQALDDAGNLTESTVQVKRLPGAPDSISLRGPASVKAGQSAVFLLSVLDETGTDSADRTKVQADVSPNLGTFDPQTAIFTAGQKSGTAVITVRAGRSQSSLSVTVEPGPLDHIAVTPAQTSLGAGESANFTVNGFDAFGNPVAVSDVQWSATSGSFQTGGRYQAPADPGTAPYTVTANVSGLSATATVYPLNFQAADVKVTATPASFRANGTAEVLLTATVVDSKGKPVTDYKGTLSVETSDSSIIRPVESVVPVAGGIAQIRLKAGTVSGLVRVTVSTNLGRTGAITLTGMPQQFQSVRLTGRSLPSTDGTPMGIIEAVALDADGNPIRTPLQQTVVIGLTATPAGAGTVRFVSTGLNTADVALFDLDPDTGDVRSHLLVEYDSGAGTVLIDGKAKPKSMEWVKVFAGAISGDQAGMPARVQIEPLVDVAAGQQLYVYVNVLDAAGYRVTQAGPLSGIRVSLRDQNGQVWLPTPSEAGRFQFAVTQQQAGTYTYTALLQPQGATATATGKVTAGVLDHVELEALPAAFPADGRTQIILRAKLLDTAGNLVSQPYEVTFSRDANRGVTQPPVDMTVTSRNGVAELKVTAGQVVATENYRAVVGAVQTPWVAVTSQGQPQRLALKYGDNSRDGTPDQPPDATGIAGVPFTVVVDVLDQFGDTVTYESNRRITLTAKNLATGTVAATSTGTTKEGEASLTLTLKDAGTYAIKAESTGLQSALTQGYGGAELDASIQPSFYTGVRLAVDLMTLKVGDPSGYAWVKAQLVDANGNAADNQSGRGINVDLQLGATTYGYFTPDDLAGPVRVLIRTVTIPAGKSESLPVKLFPDKAGSVAVQGETRDGVKSKAVTVSVVQSFGSIARLELAQSTEGAPPGSRLIAITAKDSSGRRLSDMSGRVTLTSLSASAAVTGTYDSATGQVQPVPVDLMMDRGQLMVIVSGPAGTTVPFTVLDPATNISNTIYVQF